MLRTNFAYGRQDLSIMIKRKNKGIYGSVFEKDLIELNEEGIETQLVPWIEDKNN